MKTGNIIRIVLIIFTITLFGCSDNENEVDMWIAAEKVMEYDPVSSSEYPMIQYKFKESDKWMSGENVVGFDYEEGYEYHLLVKTNKVKNPAQDQSTTYYSLVKIISKTKKDNP